MKIGVGFFLVVSILSFSGLVASVRADAPAAQAQAYYSCPMHPEVHSDSPGECPICHMKLQKVNAILAPADSKKERKIEFYRNPMNPSITSKTPAKDNMGMDFIPVYTDAGSDVGENVLGRASIRLDETQFKLSGVALIHVTKKDLESPIPVGGRALSASRVSLQVPEHDLPQVKSGLEVELQSPATGSLNFKGKIVSLDSLLDPMTRSLRVDVQLTQAVPGLRSEVSVTGSIQLARHQVLVIPDASIFYMNDSAYVYVADRTRDLLIPKKVKLGLRSADQAEVIEGLSEDDWISSGPNFLIDSESRIRASHD